MFLPLIRISRCGAQWCYMCKGPWSAHGSATGGNFKCNIYEEQQQKKSHLDWEGYSEEERKRLLDDRMTARAKRFDAILPMVRLQEEAMEIIARKLVIARKILASPHLIYHMHGVAAPEGTGTVVLNPVSSLSVDDVSASNIGTEQHSLRERIISAITSTMRHGVLANTQLRRESLTSSDTDSNEEDGSDEDLPDIPRHFFTKSLIHGGGVSESKTSDASPVQRRHRAPLVPNTLLPPPDPRAEYEITMERRRLDSLILAYEALSEFHRVEKW